MRTEEVYFTSGSFLLDNIEDKVDEAQHVIINYPVKV